LGLLLGDGVHGAELGEEILLGRQGQEVRVGEDGVEIFAHRNNSFHYTLQKGEKLSLGGQLVKGIYNFGGAERSERKSFAQCLGSQFAPGGGG